MTAQRRSLLALVALFALVFAACGGDDDDGNDGVASIDEDSAEGSGDSDEDDDGGGGGDGSEPTEQEFQDAMLEYAQCMRDHGIDMPDPEFDGEGGVSISAGGGASENPRSQEEFEAADEACSPIMEEVAPQEQLTPEEQAELQDQMLEVAQCMRDKGHNMPDPEVGENGEVRVTAEAAPGESGGPPEQDENFEDDMQACEEQAGVERRRRGGSSTEEDS